MSQLLLNPYLNLQGKAREAMEFYQSAFGGKLDLSTFGDTMSDAGENADKIMHARLEADGIVIMASDGSPQHPATVGDNFSMSLSGTDSARLTELFGKLSEGGMVKQPLTESPWGATFGFFADKYGINWMVNIEKA